MKKIPAAVRLSNERDLLGQHPVELVVDLWSDVRDLSGLSHDSVMKLLLMRTKRIEQVLNNVIGLHALVEQKLYHEGVVGIDDE